MGRDSGSKEQSWLEEGDRGGHSPKTGRSTVEKEEEEEDGGGGGGGGNILYYYYY
jgi:hypothetical protein